MLISNLTDIGNKLYAIRKTKGLTQANVAEKAELSDRAYADIERGNTNMRVETLIRICDALNITPNDILTIESEITLSESVIAEIMKRCSESEKQTALNLLNVYLGSLNK